MLKDIITNILNFVKSRHNFLNQYKENLDKLLIHLLIKINNFR